MAYDEMLAERVRQELSRRQVEVREQKMFGGIAFMVRGHMALGVTHDDLMVRVGPEQYEQALQQAHARPMEFTGRPMRGMVFVGPGGTARATNVARWVKSALRYADTQPEKKPTSTKKSTSGTKSTKAPAVSTSHRARS
jgi:hypothetical protein